jgi:hypothetical protein
MLTSAQQKGHQQNRGTYHQERSRSSTTACFAADAKKNHGVALVIESAADAGPTQLRLSSRRF